MEFGFYWPSDTATVKQRTLSMVCLLTVDRQLLVCIRLKQTVGSVVVYWLVFERAGSWQLMALTHMITSVDVWYRRLCSFTSILTHCVSCLYFEAVCRCISHVCFLTMFWLWLVVLTSNHASCWVMQWCDWLHHPGGVVWCDVSTLLQFAVVFLMFVWLCSCMTMFW